MFFKANRKPIEYINIVWFDIDSMCQGREMFKQNKDSEASYKWMGALSKA